MGVSGVSGIIYDGLKNGSIARSFLVMMDFLPYLKISFFRLFGKGAIHKGCYDTVRLVCIEDALKKTLRNP